MLRFLVVFFVLGTVISCSKTEVGPTPPVVIPNIISGAIDEVYLAPIDLTTPDKGGLLIAANNTVYKVEFNVTTEALSNAILTFDTDTILVNDSREFANLGKDLIAYRPVGANNITIDFKDGRKISGIFDPVTSFGGTFGETVISQWRTTGDPTKPTQKAKDDIIGLVNRYFDKNGAGPGQSPTPLLVTVSRL